MSNEEAIETLKELNKEYFCDEFTEANESLIMAISSLQNQQTLEEYKKNVIKVLKSKKLEKNEILNDLHEGYNIGLNNAIEVVKGGSHDLFFLELQLRFLLFIAPRKIFLKICDYVNKDINNQPQVQPIVRTQADRIRNMSDEELAELIDKVEFCKGKVLEECEPEECNDCAGCCSNTLAWLQSEVKEV